MSAALNLGLRPPDDPINRGSPEVEGLSEPTPAFYFETGRRFAVEAHTAINLLGDHYGIQ